MRIALFFLGIIAATVWIPVKLLADMPAPGPGKVVYGYGDDENFPESRFGAPPAAPDLGAGPRDRIDVAEVGGGRSPASVPMVEPPLNPGQMTPMPEKLAIPESAMAVQEVALIAGEKEYFPKKIFVTQGMPVRIYVTGAAKKSLCLILDQFQIKREVQSQKVEEIQFTPKNKGAFRFYCPVNGIEGTLFVRESSSAVKEAE